MKELDDLRKVQKLEYNLLTKFKEICEQEGLKYYLVGGTLLGAVRHKGFIPWDDDVDVALLRPDYEKFLSVAGRYLENGQSLKHYTLDENYHAYTMKMVDENAYFLTKREFTTTKNNIWIDIFPLDGTPESKIKRRFHFLKMDFLRMKLALCYIDQVRIDEERGHFKKIIVYLGKHIRVGKLMNPTVIKRQMDKELKKTDVGKAKYIGNHTVPDHDIAMFPADGYGEGQVLQFEDDLFTGPKNTSLFLRIKYGDFMKFPPKDKQVPKHHILEIVINETKKTAVL